MQRSLRFVVSLLLFGVTTSLPADEHGLVLRHRDGADGFVQRVGEPLNLTGDPDEYLADEYLRRPHPNVATLDGYFEEAAAEFGVPATLLKAFGQYKSNWTQIGPSHIGGWGVMHLVRNDDRDTLGEAAALLGLPEQVLKDDARQNIRGAAALLARYAGNARGGFASLENWRAATAQLTGLTDPSLQAFEADDIFEALRDGVDATTYWDEPLHLAPEPSVAPRTPRKELTIDGGNGVMAVMSIDYPSADEKLITCIAKFKTGRGKTVIDTWVNHWVASGTYASNIQRFTTCQKAPANGYNVSAHFLVGTKGEITQLVRVDNTAHHAGIDDPGNPRSIGVEHQVTTTTAGDWEKPALLRASAGLARTLAKKYGIKMVRSYPGVAGHSDLKPTACPGPLPWNMWMTLYRGQDVRIVTRPKLSPDPIRTNKPLTVTVEVKNYSDGTYSGPIAVALHNASGQFLGDIEVRNVVLGAYEKKTISFTKSKIYSTAGKYQLQVKYLLSQGNEWRLVPAEGTVTNPLVVNITQ